MSTEILAMPRADDLTNGTAIALSYQWTEEVPLTDSGWTQIEGGA